MATVSGALSAAEKSMRSVFVGNISYDASEELLQEIFGQVGPVLKFKLVYDRETGKPKGYGFCEYKDQETALSAMRNLNGYELNGRTLRVDHAASEKNKEELKQLQQALGGPRAESLYGEPVHPEQAPEAISKAVASLPPEQMYELMKQMKLCIQNNPNEARNMLLQNPQLAYALLQAQVIMKVIDPKVAVAMLHRQRDQIPPIVLNEQQNPPPPAAQSPMSAPMAQSPLQQQSPQFSQADIDQDMRLQQRSGMFSGPPQSGFGGPPVSGPPRGSGPKPALLGDRPPGPEPLLGDPRGPRMGPPVNMRPPFPGSGAPPEDIPRLDAQIPPSSRAGPLDPRARGIDPRDPRGMPSDPRAMPADPRGIPADPRGMPTSMAGDMRPMPADPRAMANDARSMGGPMPRDPRGAPPGRNAPSGQMGAGAVGAAAAGFLAAGGVAGPPQPTSAGGITQQDQEKAALIMQVLQLTDQQIAMLPAEQRQSILILKEQIARSSTRE